MKERWEITKGYRHYGVHLMERNRVVIWESSGGNPHTEVGSAYKLEEFLKGNGQSFVETNFGAAILAEVLAAVKSKL